MSDGINHGQTIRYCNMCGFPEGVCKCQIDIPSIHLHGCPLCGATANIYEGFDIDCESTTATIECTKCPIMFGPMYPDTKHDVVRMIERWNKRNGDN
jgi:hypothetical protein